MSAPVLERLAAELRAEGGLVARAIPAALDPDAAAAHGALVARGPRAEGRADELALVVEAVREGYLLHHGPGRVVVTDDADLALLAGDRLYALGLSRLADVGDLESVAALAELIALCAQARAEEDSERAEAAWEAGVVAVGWGDRPELGAARAAARADEAGATEALRAAARHVAANVAPADLADASGGSRLA